jgi:hypothetical protein
MLNLGPARPTYRHPSGLRRGPKTIGPARTLAARSAARFYSAAAIAPHLGMSRVCTSFLIGGRTYADHDVTLLDPSTSHLPVLWLPQDVPLDARRPAVTARVIWFLRALAEHPKVQAAKVMPLPRIADLSRDGMRDLLHDHKNRLSGLPQPTPLPPDHPHHDMVPFAPSMRPDAWDYPRWMAGMSFVFAPEKL